MTTKKILLTITLIAAPLAFPPVPFAIGAYAVLAAGYVEACNRGEAKDCWSILSPRNVAEQFGWRGR